MEQRAVVDVVKLRVIRRQRIAEENHICRIRLATAIRMSELLPSALKVITPQDSYVSEDLNYFSNWRKSNLNCVGTKFWEGFNKNKSRQSLPGIYRITGERRKWFNVPGRNNINSHSLRNINFIFQDEFKESYDDEEIFIPKNPFSSQDDEYSFNEESRESFDNKDFSQSDDLYSSESDEIDFIRNVGEISDDEEVSTLKSPLPLEDNISDTEDKLKEIYANDASCISKDIRSSGDNKGDFECELQEVSDDKEIFKSIDFHSSEDSKSGFESNLKEKHEEGRIVPLKCPNSSKHIIVLKWLHGRRNTSAEDENCTSNENSIDGIPQAQKNVTHPISQVIQEVLDESSSFEVEKSASKENIISINPQTQKNEIDPTAELIKHISDVEIRISETGKLQIIFDSKNISPGDAAIVIWTTDVLKKLFVPECDLRLCLTPESYVEQTEYSTEVIGSKSEIKLENAPKTTSDSDLPLVASKSNEAVNSKFKMKSLSVLFKRSDLGQNFSFLSN